MSRKRHKVCLITPNHISTNPRLVKEATALSEAGYLVHLVFSQHVTEAVREDIKILSKNPEWTYDYLNWSDGNFKTKSWRLFSGLQQKIGSLLNKKINWLLLEKIELNRNYFFQLGAAVKSKPDFFIAHNAGALAVAGDAAERLGCGFGFDAEDFHRGQLLPPGEKEAVIKLEDFYIKKATYVSAASPLIAMEYDELYEITTTVINNVFPLIKPPVEIVSERAEALKLFWFSQSVGLDRGLQDVFAAMKKVEQLQLEFHIFGNISPSVLEEFKRLLQQLKFSDEPKVYLKGTLSPDELLHEAKNYDIGLAIEPGFCRNNEIALSNKIFTYLLGGNAIIFSDTPAQLYFYQTNPGIGCLYKVGDHETLASHLKTYYYDRGLLQTHKQNSFLSFCEEHNWNQVKKDFLRQISSCLETKEVVAK